MLFSNCFVRDPLSGYTEQFISDFVLPDVRLLIGLPLGGPRRQLVRRCVGVPDYICEKKLFAVVSRASDRVRFSAQWRSWRTISQDRLPVLF